MPRIMTMNGDHQSVATAPLDLSTSARERGSAAGSRTPDCSSRAGDARASSCSPAPPACTGTDSLEIHTPDPKTSGGRKRTADASSLRLPFRKRPIPVEADTQEESPAAESADRGSPAEAADSRCRESLCAPVERRAVVSAPAPMQIEEARLSPNGYLVRFVPFSYGHHRMVCLPSVPERSHPLIHQPENLYHSSIVMATRQDEDGDTALHIAVVQGELGIVCKLIHLLLLADRSLDIYNNLRQTPLHLAVITKQPNMVEALLRAGAEPSALDRNGQTALHLCCEYDQRDCLSVVLALSMSSSCLEIRNYEGLSPLHLAVLQGRKDLARLLLDAGADINAMDVKSGQTPLMHAVENNNADLVRFLIENGCDVNSQSYSGNTALHSACGRGQVDTVRLLLKSGADSGLKNYHNDTPVNVAKNKKIADVLRGRGSKQIRVQDQHCRSDSPHGSNFTESGSPSPSNSRGCSPLTTSSLHHSASHSPKTPSVLRFPFL
ncbi:B-cell lymphoma 3 protein homolog [Salarias fasciatus]|uniref:Uncharacterized protein n=1 Tax=Salarias fasciatus TaxID=181472 RepID=A0A672FF35_SALFA|nr:B-cell lymphoma 3 protein [Salarias fasciatus]